MNRFALAPRDGVRVERNRICGGTDLSPTDSLDELLARRPPAVRLSLDENDEAALGPILEHV